jgi:FAD/FMN-containing dehydrogenase
VGEVVGQILVLAVGVALSPIPIIAVVGGIILLLSSGAGASDHGAPADWVSWLKLILAVVLFGIAIRQWRSRPHAGGQADLPKWMQTIDRFTPGRSVAIGVALSAINPKNLLLTVGAATTRSWRPGWRPTTRRSCPCSAC